MFTARRFLAGNCLPIQRAYAMTAVESGSERTLLEHSQEVTLGIPLRVRKDQPAIRIHRLAHLE
jgi:hypothetical protein